MRAISALIKLVSGGQIFGLLFLFFGLAVWRFLHVKIFDGMVLTFGGVGVFLRPDYPSGLSFIEEIIEKDVYGEFDEVVSGHEPVLLDIGANVGLMSLVACRKNPALKVCCFEPHPETFSLLSGNVTLNKLSDRIKVFHGAISDRSGTISIDISAGLNMARTVESGEKPVSDTIEVTSWSVDDFCASQGVMPTALKVDVEGHEVSVLKGAERTLGHVRQVMLETHSAELTSTCRALLEAQGFSVRSTDSGLLYGCK